MSTKRMAGMAVLGALVATQAVANHEGGNGSYGGYSGGSYQGEQYEYAQVISSEPLVRQVHVTVPRRECYSETHYVPVYAGRYGGRYGSYGAGPSTAGSMILGGLIGAAIGHQVGNQQSRHTGAIAGAIIGSAIGNEAAQRRTSAGGSYRGEELRAVEGQRCEVINEEHVEERIDGYRVTYRYNDRTYTTQTARDPGAQIRVSVSVRPLG